MTRIYNGGDRIQEKMLVDHPDGHDNACKSYYTVDIPARAFSELPREVTIAGHRIAADVVEFAQLSHPWVVVVDKNLTEAEETESAVSSDGKAKEKAQSNWRSHLQYSAEQHLLNVETLKGRNITPPRATGFAKRALEELGLEDPAVNPALRIDKNETVEEMKRQIAELTKLVNSKK